MLGLGVSVLAKLLWDALNWRPPPGLPATGPGAQINTGTAVDVDFVIRYIQGSSTTEANGCYPPYRTFAGSEFSGSVINLSVRGVGITYGALSSAQVWACGGSGYGYGDVVPAVTVRKADGTEEVAVMNWEPVTYYGQDYSYTTLRELRDVRVVYNGNELYPEPSAAPEFAEGTRPLAPAPAPDPALAPVPWVLPKLAPISAPADMPDVAPITAPASAPGGLPSTAPSPRPAPSIATAQAQAPAVVPATPAPVAVPAIGPLPAPAPLPVPVTPEEAVVLDGELVSGPGQAPAPNLTAMAAELGRLERKGEMTLDRLKGLSALDDLAELLPSLLEFLATVDGGTTYSIQPPCGTKANGDPLDPVEVIVPPTIGPENATIARLDALAMLLDEHKSIRQPICKGKPAGAPVTVTGVELEP